MVLTALSKSSAPNAIDRIVSIIKRMEEHIEEGQEHIRPNTRSWNALLNALSRERSEESSDRAEQLLSHMYKLHSEGINVKPDAFSYVAVLGCLQKSSNPLAVERADEILRSMEELHDNGDLDDPPDVYHYTIVCAAWAKSRQQRAPGRVMQILAHMTELDAAGVPHVRPNVRTYNAVLDCLARGGSEDEAERLLDHMLFLSQQGEECLDSFSFNCCINAFCRKNDDDGGRRAEMVLERFLEYNEDHPRCKPDSRSFTRIIDFYRRSRQPDAPYRAEYILNRMIALFVAGNSGVKPNPFSFKAVMDAYSSARHPDAGVTAERLLRQMKELDKKYDQLNLALDSSVVHRVLFAWSTCGDEDAGRRAEIHLDDMERKYLAGDETMKPTTRSYGLVLNAWSKSSSFDKAKRSLDILKRMEKQRRLGNTDVYLSEHVHSLVINACAFTNSGMEAETEAFRIAVTIFDKMIASKDCQPSSLAYGWFIQACGRLQMPQDMKDRHIERAWNLCCQNGLVNGFVLHRFTGAAPEVLYKKLMASVLSRISSHPDDTKEKLKFRISPKDLPLAWTKKANNFHKQDGNSGWWGK